jgi:hypothetical protein
MGALPVNLAAQATPPGGKHALVMSVSALFRLLLHSSMFNGT